MNHTITLTSQDNTPEIEQSLGRDAVEAGYGVTILETVTVGGRVPLLTKTIMRGTDGKPVVGDYDNATWFKFHLRQCTSIAALLAILTQLERYPRCAIVRGAPVDGLDLARSHRRLLHRQGDGTPPTLCDVEWYLVGFDVDGAPEVPGIDWRTHPREALDAAWKRDRPEWCRDVDFVA